jgi:flavin reductase (DIM6/NTAB) family NADH-FMN oxidoreductase RutF
VSSKFEAPSVADISLIPDVITGSMNSDEFKKIFRHHAAGVAVVTADAGDGPVAMTVTSMFSISAEPPLFVFSASALSSSTPTLLRAETLVVHLLGSDQLWLGKLASTSGNDRFADTAQWRRLETGEPMYVAARAWVRGRVVKRLDAGSATLFVIQALESFDSSTDQEAPLVYHNRKWHALTDSSEASMPELTSGVESVSR